MPTHAPKLLVTRPGSVSAFLTCHACRLPYGTWPSHGSFLSQWISNDGAYCRVPTPHAQILRELGLSLLELGVWLGNHLSRLLSLFGVPPPIVPSPPRSFLPVGIGRWPLSDTSTFLVWTQSTPKVGQLSCLPHCTLMDPTIYWLWSTSNYGVGTNFRRSSLTEYPVIK